MLRPKYLQLYKHSKYLISNSELFGLSKKDVQLIAMVARYHRRASPQPRHDGYSELSREERIAAYRVGPGAAHRRVHDGRRTEDLREHGQPGRARDGVLRRLGQL